MSKHTRGPWKVGGNNLLFVEPLGIEASTDGRDITSSSQIYTKRTIEEAQANARLIAAAPNCYKLLKDFVDGKFLAGGKNLFKEAESLLKKIEGGKT